MIYTIKNGTKITRIGVPSICKKNKALISGIENEIIVHPQ